MIFPAPTATEERNGVLHERVRRLRKEGVIGDGTAAALLALWVSPWKSHRTVLAAVFFVMTCGAIAAFNGLLAIFDLLRGPLVLIACIALAEWLIRNRRMFGTGIEAALFAGGFVSFISWLPSEGKPEALLVFALAAAVTSWRVHSPLFGTAAVLLSYAYLVVRSEKAFVLPLALGCAMVVAVALVLIRPRERPWIELFLSYTLVMMLPATYAAVRFVLSTRGTAAWLGALFVLLAAALIALGLSQRHHAHLLAAAVAGAIAAIESWDAVHAAPEAKLIMAGALLLGGSLAATRVLHNRTAGVIVTPVQWTPLDSALQIATVAAGAATQQAHTDAAQPIGGGGASGGGGATGEWR